MRTIKLLINKTLLLGIMAGILLVASSCSTGRNYPRSAPNPYIDPVCGIQAEPEPHLIKDYNGITYYFDSEECLSVFNKNPENFAKTQNRRNSNHMGLSGIGWWAPVMVVTMAVVMLVGFSH